MMIPTYGNEKRRPHKDGVSPIKHVARNFYEWLAHEPAFIKLHEDYARCMQAAAARRLDNSRHVGQHDVL